MAARSGERVVPGFAVGAVGPDVAGVGYLDRLRSFSAPIEIRVDGTGGSSPGTLGTIVMPYYDAELRATGVRDLAPVDPLDLSKSMTGVPSRQADGFAHPRSTASIPIVDGGAFEARYFGRPGGRGLELAGRLRLRTTAAWSPSAAFGGARFVRAVP